MSSELPEQFEPTFYLGGQPYIYTDGSLDGSSDMAEMAFFETFRNMYRLFWHYYSGTPLPEGCGRPMSREQYTTRIIELELGMWRLRENIDRKDTLIPNFSFILVH